MSWADLAALYGHCLALSLLAIGGAITVAPDLQRYMVVEQGWLSSGSFTESIAIAQAAPGPNVLFLAVLGWQAGGAAGLLACLSGMLLPSSLLALHASRWGARRQDHVGVQAFHAAMAPISLGLLLSTCWLLSQPTRHLAVADALLLATLLVMWRSKLNPLWMLGLGGLVGGMGWLQ
ncbi:MAG: chromate transporter [Pseudomonadota bacterium]|jgi:chromate transporter